MNTRLRDLREDNDLTQEQAAIIGCISKKSYERYENGVRDIPLEIIVKYSCFFKLLNKDDKITGYSIEDFAKLVLDE